MLLHCCWNANSTATLENSMAIFNNFKYTHSIVVVLVTVSDSYNPVDCSPSGSSVHGISQARMLECVAISCSRGSSPSGWQVDSLPLSHQGSIQPTNSAIYLPRRNENMCPHQDVQRMVRLVHGIRNLETAQRDVHPWVNGPIQGHTLSVLLLANKEHALNIT